MFRWYRRSTLCITYLTDVPTPRNASWDDKDKERFRKSKWFTRGWTLQELLAPRDVEFYSQDWDMIGTKGSLRSLISEESGINEYFIQDSIYVGQACAAQKISWISKRQTTREEDLAYCLLGLFQVNMPLLYGEGNQAFIRLQEEILKRSCDHTLFAWFATDEDFPDKLSIFPYCSSGLLAPTPALFAASSDVRRRWPDELRDKAFLDLNSHKAYQMTNRGLEIELALCEVQCNPPYDLECHLAVLNCYFEGNPAKSIALHIRRQEDWAHTDGHQWQFLDGDHERTHLEKIVTVDHETLTESKLETIFVRRSFLTDISPT